MKTQRYEMNILGHSFAMQTSEDPKYLDSLVDFINERIEEISSQGVTSSTRCIILAAFYLADELVKLKSLGTTPIDKHEYKNIKKRIEVMLEKVDKVIREDSSLF